jgi:hypothetical protein
MKKFLLWVSSFLSLEDLKEEFLRRDEQRKEAIRFHHDWTAEMYTNGINYNKEVV